jgi:hypothetical protein
MVKVTIEINGRQVSPEEAEQVIHDTILAAKIEQVRTAVGDLPVTLDFQGDLRDLRLTVKNCPHDLVDELNRRLKPFV